MIEILKHRSVICVSGSDAQRFLQSMTTNDVIQYRYSYNYLLNNQGRYLFDLFVYSKNDNEYLLDIHTASASDLIKYLMLYKLRSNVMIDNHSNQYSVLYTRDALTNQFYKGLSVEYSERDPRHSLLGYRSIAKNLLHKLSESNVIEDLYIKDKYNYSIIDGYADLTYQRSIPVEYGAEELHAISYDKGCYIGQEVISRAKYQGVIRKKIFNLYFDDSFLDDLSGFDIHDFNGDKLGIVCSNYQNHAIALLREEKYLGLDKKLVTINNRMAKIILPVWRSES